MATMPEFVSIGGEDVNIEIGFHGVILTQMKNDMKNMIIIADVGDCNLIIDALERIKANKVLLLKGLENEQ